MQARRVAWVLVMPWLGLLSSCGRHETVERRSAGIANDAPPLLLVLSAMPAEMAPILAQASVDRAVEIHGRTFSLGTLRGVRVALGLTGIGIENAQAAAREALASLPATGVVFSGVAGGPFRIGDVAVPQTWSLSGDGGTGKSFAADPTWLSLAGGLTTPCYEQCTVVQWTGEHVCLDHVPGLVVGGAGQSQEAKSSGDCDPGGDDVFGCEVGTPQGDPESCHAGGTATPADDPDAGPSTMVDNETAAVAAEAAARGLPFIAFRSLSDGAGDPLGLPGFPGQFFAYYRLAARNAAATTLAFVERLR
jgi:hypothetical protein